MKRFLLFIVTSSLLLGEVIPTRSLTVLEEKFEEIDADTWVVFDIDMTLIVPKESILWGVAEPVFFSLAREVNPHFDDRDKLEDWGVVLRDMEWELLTPEGPEIVKKFQDKGAKVIALTAMGHGPVGVLPSIGEWRVEQLLGLGFDFSKNAPFADLPNYQGGILFSDKAPKGEVLKALLDHLREKPKKVIFVDDRLDFITSVDEMMEEAGIDATCYHFREIEYRSVNFVPALVREKLRYFFAHDVWPTP